MFYRVDYVLALILVGFVAGLLFGGRAAQLSSPKLGRIYYSIVSVILVISTLAFTLQMVGIAPDAFHYANAALADTGSILFGALFGIACRRQNPRELLTGDSVLNALRMSLAFTFGFASVGKSLSMGSMTEFFTQSGYSTGFLKFIIIAELFGAFGLLLEWAFVPALLGLTVDMWGAVVTHVHNGDPLNDSTGAIILLLKMFLLALLWTMRRAREEIKHRFAVALVTTGTVWLLALVIAIGGNRDLSRSKPALSGTVVRH